MINKKQILFYITFITIILIFVSCQKNDGIYNDEELKIDMSESRVTEEDVSSENEHLNYVLVYPSNEYSAGYSSYLELKKILATMTESIVASVTDDNISEYNDNGKNTKILFGNTDCPESIEALSRIGYGEYIIAFIEDKLVIASHEDDALAIATDQFLSLCKLAVKDGILKFEDNVNVTGQVDSDKFKLFSKVPVFKGGVLHSIKDCGDNFYQSVIYDTDKEKFDQYCASLETLGFSLYAQNEMAENYFMTYTKGDFMLHAYFITSSGEVRIVAAENANLPSYEKTDYIKVTDSGFTLLGLEKGGKAGGFGSVLKLEDGSFIIIDGGHSTVEEAEDIYNTIHNLATDKGNITIKAWMFTHAHSDHYGAFNKFCELYGHNDNITIENFIYNYCDTKEQTQYLQNPEDAKKATRNIPVYYPDAKIYKPLTGQIFNFAGVKIEILYCMSDFLPNVIGTEVFDADKKNADGNIKTVVYRFYIAGQSIMITGDTSKICVDEMCKRYGEYLKSDMMTVPHHGWNEARYRARNGTIEFYTLIDPTIVFWPDGDEAQVKKMNWNGKKYGNWEANHYLIYSLNVKEHYVSGSTTRTFVLPYTGIKSNNETITSFSPDGKYCAEAYGTNTDITAGGLFPYEGIRILHVDTNNVIWEMKPGGYTVSFTWSLDSRYAGIYYTGRIWGESFVVDIKDEKLISLPNLDEVASHYDNGVKPQENRPDPYFVIDEWEDTETVIVNFCWTKADGEEFNGQYAFNIKTNTVVYK